MTVITTVGAMMDAIKQASDMERPERPRLRDGVHYIPTEFETRLRIMIAYVARQQAREAVILKIKQQGKAKVSLMSRAQITRLAMAHLRAHEAELLAQAEASGVVRQLRLAHEQKLVDLEAKSLCGSPVQNGGQQ